MADPVAADRLRQHRPHSGRMYDYYLGGRTNYAVDREAAETVMRRFPAIRVTARVNRAFTHRAARFLARDRGLRQFLDIGTGIPTAPNLHEVVQAEVPEARVAYADNDPIVLVYADSLLGSTPEGRTGYVEADLTEPAGLLAAVAAGGCLDLSEPVALSLNAVLPFVPDDKEPYAVVATLMDRLAPGSYLTLSHATGDFAPEVWAEVVGVYAQGGTPAQVRSHAEVERFFSGLVLEDPGVVLAHRWRPDPADGPAVQLGDNVVSLYVGMARKE
ncbi:SAM-dependent methyltransferase [Actinacidiphila yeochonensis]|uniref:SAM-dependent methyltransferase n=1 Tax=Actinacidiphila yeochonensis TaxID=89050 RepID=UPI002244F774|nr:SAM-dependent methyltransferase [Actinacidiphila yeochonensis]